MNSKPFRFLIALLATFALHSRAEVRLPALFSDHMVLQQGMRVPIWGWADEGDQVTVTFRNQTVKAKAKNGKWMVKLSRLKAGGPDILTVAGQNKIELTNVMVGEVWVCSGQSNMEWPMDKAYEPADDIATAANPSIRLFLVAKTKANAPTNDVRGQWKESSPDSVRGFSAVAYYFARDLQKARQVPIGLIGTYWGGSPAEAWTSERVLSANPDYQRHILEAYVAAVKKLENTETNARPQRPPWKPGELYNGMIAPIIPYGIKGAIWYQGESNAGRAHQYRTLFADMIRNWRNDWGQSTFPFLLVQLAPFKEIKNEPGESDWAELREAQLLATKVLPKVGMAVITDVGEEKDIHPRKKQPVGARLALAARAIAYGENLDYSGPIFKKMKVKGNEAVLSFDHASCGLDARGGELKGFAICGPDRKFVWAKAEIEGDKVVVSSPEVSEPVAVRYGWADFPVVNLWNQADLPATPFRTDDFPMITAPKK